MLILRLGLAHILFSNYARMCLRIVPLTDNSKLIIKIPMIMKNQLLNLKMIALMCLMMVLGGANAYAISSTLGPDWDGLFGTSYDGSTKSKVNLSGTNSDGVYFAYSYGSSTNAGYVKTSDLRAYSGYTLTITAPTNTIITSIQSEPGTTVKNEVSISSNVGKTTVTNTKSGKKYLSSINWVGSSNSVIFTVGKTITFEKITVTYASAKTLTSLAISGEPTKKTYEVGEEFDPTGLVVTGTYDDKSTATITDGITWAMNPATLSLNDVSCSVTATVDGVTSPAYDVTGLTVNKAKLPATITLTGNATTLGIDEPNKFTVDYDGDGTLSATASAEGVVDLTLVGKTVTVTPKAVGSVDITVAATEGTEYKAASKTYTVTVVPVGIAAIRNSITSISSSKKDAFTAKIKDAVVTYVGKPTYSGGAKTIYVEDANAGIVFYGSDFTYEEGDVLNGTISGEGFVYQGLTEVTSIDASSNIVVTKNGVIPCQEVTVDELNKNMDKWESRRVKLLDVTVSSAMNGRNAEISQDGNTIAVYEKIDNCSGDLLSKVNTKIASIVCYPQDRTASSNTTNQLCIWEESDIVVVTAEPTYTAQTLTFIAKDGADYYATFSSDKVTFITSKHVIPYVVTVANGKVEMNSEMFKSEKTTIESAEVDGYYIPANTGILLYSDAENVDYYTVENKTVDAISPVDNMLEPAPKDGGIFAFNEGYKYYKLAYNDYTNRTGLGFYWGANNGGAFYVKGGTAYLKVLAATTAGAKGFTLNGEATGIEGVNANVENAKAIYNLNGQRVASMAKPGLYIVNGKKVVRK